ncbi:MAG: ferritin family protein [Candidatus Thermoplasmatota archaeon]|nr:ferritin family protein [Candidatus Thermoplasmatota archaeon]
MAGRSEEHLLVLRNAIQMEMEGKDFFERAASKVQHARAKQMFEGLVKQEQRHIDVLGKEFERLSQGKSWMSLKEAEALPSGLPRVSVFKDAKLKRIRFPSNAGELEALKIGMDVEQKSIDYYTSARDRVANTKAKAIFSWLVKEESGHLTILSAEYEYRKGSGFYYDEPEFSLEVM